MRTLPIQMKGKMILHIIKIIVSSLLSPFRALHNWVCKQRLRKYLRLELPTRVSEASLRSEEDSIEASKQLLSIDNITKEDRIVNFNRACFQEFDDYQGCKAGRVASLPESSDTLTVFQSWGADYA